MGTQPRSQRTGKTQGNIRGHPEEGHGCARRGGAGHTDEGQGHLAQTRGWSPTGDQVVVVVVLMGCSMHV